MGDGEAEGAQGGSNYAFEMSIIEQGTVVLGGTDKGAGFELRQQYFHKVVMLLLTHDETFTRGIILNRPSALLKNGWRVWCGGDVETGNFFSTGPDNSQREGLFVCLHSLNIDAAKKVSTNVIKGVWWTSFVEAQRLVLNGLAKKEDFWVFAGYAGWGPGQLQGEVNRKSWFLASADSGTLLSELLRQATEMPPPSAGCPPPGDGLATWESLMTSIGRSEDVERTRGSLGDRMLARWCEAHLVPHDMKADKAKSVSPLPVGTVLRTGSPSDRAVLKEQFLHKSVLIKLGEILGTSMMAVLNRPTAQSIQIGKDTDFRRLFFGGGVQGDERIINFLIDSARDDTSSIGVELGTSGLRQVEISSVQSLDDHGLELSDLLVVYGIAPFSQEEIESMLQKGELHVLKDPRPLWPQIWQLASKEMPLSDGTDVWATASQLDRQQVGEQQPDVAGDAMMKLLNNVATADEALKLWVNLFQGK
jgi:putative transcriptional regulator